MYLTIVYIESYWHEIPIAAHENKHSINKIIWDDIIYLPLFSISVLHLCLTFIFYPMSCTLLNTSVLHNSLFYFCLYLYHCERKISFIDPPQSKTNCIDFVNPLFCRMKIRLGAETRLGQSICVMLTVYFLPPTPLCWYEGRSIYTESHSVAVTWFSPHRCHQHHQQSIPSSISSEKE
jgi:hypothetical protein